MDSGKTTIERAFALARSGLCGSLSEVVKTLRREGYSPDQLSGPSLRKQLRELIAKANVKPSPNAANHRPKAALRASL
jgi:hypothetical protein